VPKARDTSPPGLARSMDDAYLTGILAEKSIF